MTRHSFFKAALAITLLGLPLNAATVSIVNQPTTGSSTPTGTTNTLGSGASQQSGAAQGQQKGTTPAVGKLPPSTGAAHATRKPKLEVQEPAKHVEQPFYTYPGLLAKVGRRWIGNDYLYNMHRNIGVKVEVVREEGKNISVDEEGLAAIVAAIFEGAEIVPESLASEETPPLPFFHILIFAYPTENQSIAFVSGRLFEDALLARYGLDPIGTWQAISWEKQDLVITSQLQFDEQLKKSVTAIAQTFVDRVLMYAKIKEESESSMKLYYPSVIPPQTPTHSQGLTPATKRPLLPQPAL